MKRSIITFAVLASAALALAGCSAGRHSQTANQVAPVPGFSDTHTFNEDQRVGVRNAHLVYKGVEGYEAGSSATVKIWLFNDSPSPVSVVLTSDAGTVTPSAPITIPPAGFVAPEVTLASLRQAVAFGQSVDMQVDFVGITRFTVPLTIAPPDQPLPQAKLEVPGEAGEGH